MEIKNETEWLSEDIEALIAGRRPTGTTVHVNTLRQPGRSVDRMSLWERHHNGTTLVIRLPSRQRLEAMSTALERLADPEWVNMPRVLTYTLFLSLSATGEHYERRRPGESEPTVPASFSHVLRMPTKRRPQSATTFEVGAVEQELKEAHRRLEYSASWYAAESARLLADYTKETEKKRKRISMLEKRLEKARRRTGS